MTSTTHHVGEGRRLRGISVAAKLAAFIALVVAAFMLVFGLVFARFVEETVTEQILVAAVEAARVGAQADLDAWTAFFGTEDQGLTPEAVAQKVSGMSPLQYRTYDTEQRRAQVERNQERLRGALGNDSRILAVEVARFSGGERLGLVASSYEGEMSFAPIRGASVVRSGEGRAVEGILTVSGRRQHVIRGSHPMLSAQGEQAGEMAVYIAAPAIEQATEVFKIKVAYAAGIFVFVGAGLSFLIGKLVTRPLRLLANDIRIVASGDLAHHTRTHSNDEIGELARTFDHMTRSLAEAAESERQMARSRHEVAVAAEVSASLFPDLPTLSGWELSGLHGEGDEPSGECYDVLDMPKGRKGLLVAAASGRGVPAAMVLGMARSYLRVVAATEGDPGAVLRRVNALLSPDLRRGMYVSAVLAVLDPGSGRLLFANAGHPPLLHWSGFEQLLVPVHSEGIALGFDQGPVFDRTLKVAELPLESGDRLLLYAPGVTGLRGADGSELGEARWLALVRREGSRAPAEMLARIEATLRKFAGRKQKMGDVTLLALGRPSS